MVHEIFLSKLNYNLTISKCFDLVKINYEFRTLHSKSGQVVIVFMNTTRHNLDLNSSSYDRYISQ